MIEKYFDVVTVSFMSYPQLGDPDLSNQEFYEILKRIAVDPFFNLLEINPVEDAEKKEIIKKIIAESGMILGFGGQSLILKNQLNPNSLIEEERQKAVNKLIEGIDNAHDLGSGTFTFVSGKWEKEQVEEQVDQLVKTTVEVCKYAEKFKIHVQLEVFDFDFDKSILIGPAPRALEYSNKVRQQVSNFGLMVDLSHFPQTRETSEFVLSLLREHITHLHVGNVVLEEGAPGRGDLHPRFGYPKSVNHIPELCDFFVQVKKYGLYDETGKNKMRLSFEVQPMPGEDPDLLIENSKRIMKRAWALL